MSNTERKTSFYGIPTFNKNIGVSIMAQLVTFLTKIRAYFYFFPALECIIEKFSPHFISNFKQTFGVIFDVNKISVEVKHVLWCYL